MTSTNHFTNAIEQMTDPSAEYSFIEAPPLPTEKKYLADLRGNVSASTGLKPANHRSPQKLETKFRAKRYHPTI